MTANTAPAVHRYTVDIAVPAGTNPDNTLADALLSMSAEREYPNRVHARKQPSGTVITDIDNAPNPGAPTHRQIAEAIDSHEWSRLHGGTLGEQIADKLAALTATNHEQETSA